MPDHFIAGLSTPQAAAAGAQGVDHRGLGTPRAPALPAIGRSNGRWSLSIDRLLSVGVMLLLAGITAAILRGRDHWATIPWLVDVHIVMVSAVCALTPCLLLWRHGSRAHRVMGYAWVGLMTGLAALSFGIRSSHGGFSPIHALSAFMMIQAPLLALSARRHDVRRHRLKARILVGSALLIAGVFAFLPQRLLGALLLG